MGERDTTVATEGPSEELFDPALGELEDDDFEAMDFAEAVTEKRSKRRSDGGQRNDSRC